MKLGEYERMILMHNIDNLVFKSTVQYARGNFVPPVAFNLSSSSDPENFFNILRKTI